MKIFMTGATGFLGSHLARRLLAAGHEVRALVRKPYDARRLSDAGVRVFRGDITQPAGICQAMEGADAVFHVAAMYKIGLRPHSEQVAEMYRVNVQGTRNVLSAMQDLGIRKGVYTSTIAVHSDTGGRLVDESFRYDGPHLSCYDATKWEAHYQVALPMMAQGLPLVVVQPGLVYGPGDTGAVGELITLFLRGKLPYLPGGAAYSWSHVDDIASGHMAALEKGVPGTCYHLAGPPHSLRDAFRLVANLVRRRPPPITLPPALLSGLSRIMAGIETIVKIPPRYASETLRVAAGATYLANADRARRELGFDPRPLNKGLRSTLPDLIDHSRHRRKHHT